MHKGVSDHVSDIFLDVTSPAVMLVDAAEKSDVETLEQSIDFFTNHTEQMGKVLFLRTYSRFFQGGNFHASSQTVKSTFEK